MWWSQADAATYRTWLAQAGLQVTGQQFVPEGGGHALFWAQAASPAHRRQEESHDDGRAHRDRDGR